MKLIVGLGNIGDQYHDTRHNVGFLCLDKWAAKRNKSFHGDRLFDYCQIGDTVLIKPNTYMNLSGDALNTALRRWPTDQVLVVYDDIEIPLADLRIRAGGGDGGHNGMKSLFTVMAPSALKRIRVGIGRDEAAVVSDYVLQSFTEDENKAMEPILKKVVEFIDVFVKYDFSMMLNEYSKWKKSYSGAKKPGIISPQEELND